MHRRRLTALLALVCAFAFASAVGVALAAHYHTSGYCGSQHGLVHGNHTRDGAWHGRVEISGCPNTYHSCTAWSTSDGQTLASESSYYSTCDAFYNGSRSEANAAAGTYYEAVFNGHSHYAH